MSANGFLQQRPANATSLGIVLALHAAAIGGVLLVKGPEWMRRADPPIVITNVPVPPEPDEVPPPQPKQRDTVELPRPSDPYIPRPINPPPLPGPTTSASDHPTEVAFDSHPPTVPGAGGGGTGTAPADRIIPPQPPVHVPVRTDALFDPRFAGALQPPYPTAEVRAEREGSVRLRVTIGEDGRVIAAERLSATSDAFWQAAERQALSRWRFRPATVDGRPVQASKVLTIQFRLDGQ